MADFYFSRYHLTAGGNYVEKTEILSSGIGGTKSITYRKDNFRFVYSQEERVGNKNYLVGILAKYKPEDEEQVINNNQIDNVTLQNRVLATVRFIIDPQSSIIIFEESRSHIPKDSFPKRFIELFEENYESDDVWDFSIAPITEEYNFSERIKGLAIIKKIIINLVPSNPNNADLWEEVDERLRNNRITNYKEIQENKNDGQSIIIDSETESKFYMSEDGYGVSTAKGIDEVGNPTTISTKDSNKWAKVSIPKDIDGLRAIIEACQNMLNDIVRRTNEV
jgi:hypothetical protein